MKNILVTGVAGYIGSVLVRQLLAKNYNVIGLDILNFGGESLLGVYNHPRFKFIKGDVRNISEWESHLDSVWGIIHLAAIVGDPACVKQPELAKETNWIASKNLYDLCNKKPNIKRFIFASTCSNYGKMEGKEFLNENSPLKPVSLYAELKVLFENFLLKGIPREDFITTILRFATVYGLSPRIRFDLTVNEFMKDVALGKELVIFGEQFWRPYCHVEDLARACILVLEADDKVIKQEVFGVGDTTENYQKQMIAEEIRKILPTAKIKYVHKNEDPRDYRVNFSKIKDKLGFKITKTVPDGLQEIHDIIKQGIITNPESTIYKNT
jgi:nucleoside-diphosphate-sugar epimerase